MMWDRTCRAVASRSNRCPVTVMMVLCAEAAGQQQQLQQQQQETVTVSFIEFDDYDDCVSVATERSKPTQQCYLSALLHLATDTTLDQVHTLRQGLSQCITTCNACSACINITWKFRKRVIHA